jgi:hypothetical protein
MTTAWKAPMASPGVPLKSGEEVTKRSFAEAVLLQLGSQPNSANTTKFVSWMNAEGGHWNNSARYNPLNTTLEMPGAGNTGSQGNLKVYNSWEQGITATVQTLRASAYGGIRAALSGGSQAQFEAAVNASPWGTHFSGGGAAAQGVNLGAESHHVGITGGAENTIQKAKEALEGKGGGGTLGSLIEFFTNPQKLVSGAVTVVLLLAGAVLVVYGIMVAVRPRESALNIPIPRAVPIPV